MIAIHVDASDILSWSNYLDKELLTHTRVAVSDAINAFGANVVRSTVKTIADKTGFAQDLIMHEIVVKESRPTNLVWEMDARMTAFIDQPEWEKDWYAEEHPLGQNQLYKIVTYGDKDVCEACREAAAKGPVSSEEIAAIRARWAHYRTRPGVEGVRTNLIHPNCRCTVQAWTAKRRLPMTMGEGVEETSERLTSHQLGKLVVDELGLVIKARM